MMKRVSMRSAATLVCDRQATDSLFRREGSLCIRRIRAKKVVSPRCLIAADRVNAPHLSGEV
jgi:hypothetical protein